MFIKKIIIYGYGNLHQLELEMSEQFQLLYGENEIGKSTIMSFIRHCLFGFPMKHQRERIFYPKNDTQYGGKIIIELNGEVIEIERTSKVVIVYFQDGSIGGENALQQLIGITKNIYNGIFSFDIDGLQNLAMLKEKDIGDFLLSTMMNHPNQLSQLEQNIKKEQEQLYKKNGRNPILNKELLQLDNMKNELIVLENTINEYDELKNEKIRLEESLSKVETELKQVKRVQPLVHEKKVLEFEREKLVAYSDFPKDWLAKLISSSTNDDKINLFHIQLKQLEVRKIELDKVFPKIKIGLEHCEKILLLLKYRHIISMVFLIYSVLVGNVLAMIGVGSFFMGMHITNVMMQKKNKMLQVSYEEIIQKYAEWEMDHFELHKEWKNSEGTKLSFEHLHLNRKELSTTYPHLSQKDRLFQQVRVKNEKEYIIYGKNKERFDELNRKISNINQQLLAKCNNRYTVEKIQVLKQNERLLYQQIVTIECKMDMLENGTTYQDVVYKYEQKKAIVKRLAMKYYQLKIASEYIQQTKSRFFKEKIPKVLNLVEQYFAFITENKYIKIVLSESSGMKVQESSGIWFHVNELSRGTVEQLYVSIRLAMAKIYMKNRFPMILDDPFVHFDHRRMNRLLSLLQIISKERQILFFTKQQDLVSLEYSVITLENNSRRIHHG